MLNRNSLGGKMSRERIGQFGLLILAVVLIWLSFGGLVQATRLAQAALPQHHNHHQDHQQVRARSFTPPGEVPGASLARRQIPDLKVFNQAGEQLNFYRDLVADKIVIINFIYTSCRAVCPLQGRHFAQVQTLLGQRLGREVNLISISTDPLTDTPARLKEWGQEYGVKPGWTLVTGDKAQIDRLMIALTGAVANRGEHSSVIYVVNDQQGAWIRDYGLMPPREVIALIDSTRNQ